MFPSLQSARETLDQFPSTMRHKNTSWASLLVLSLVITIILVTLYITYERTFYWWDYVTYSDLVDQKIKQFQESPLTALHQTWWSTNKDYSDYATLPLLLPVAIFGNSRLVYILSVVLIYSFPLALVLGAIATQLVPSQPKLVVYWSTVFLAFTIPVFWAPSLRGYVDAGAALLIALAMWAYLRDVTLGQRSQLYTIGFLLGFAPLFRRHFAYAAIAFLIAMALHMVFHSRPPQVFQAPLRRLMTVSRRLFWLVAISLITVIGFGLPFVIRIVRVDFTQLYSSYEVPPTQGFQYYGLSYGWIVCLLAALGFAVSLRLRVLSRPATTFISLFGSILLLLWVFKVKQLGVHYTTHFTSFIVLGLTCLVWSIRLTLRDRWSRWVLGMGGVYLLANLLFGLAPSNGLNHTLLQPTRFGMSVIPDTIGSPFSRLLSANYPPLRRSDYDEVLRMVRYLQELTPNHEPIYVGASSATLNAFTVRRADLALHQQKQLYILLDENIDSRDRYPIDRLLVADYVVVAEPFQYHIRPQDQDIIRVIVDVFVNHWEIARDFQQLPQQFWLENGAKVSIYQRIRPTTLATAIQTFETMKQFVGERPGGQYDWIVLGRNPGHYIWTGRGIHHIQTDREHPYPTTSLLYINPLPKPSAKFSGQVSYRDRQCSRTHFRISTIDAQAQIVDTAKLDHSPNQSPDISLLINTNNAAYLQLQLTSDRTNHSHSLASTPCDFKLGYVTVNPG